MSRHTQFECEECRTRIQGDLAARPRTWWLLEDQGRVQRTGPLDFCSLRCLQAWLTHDELREVYAADWKDGATT